jgi:hypothetical protein
MRYIILFISFFFLFLIQIDAKEKNTKSLSLKELIEKIKHSTSDDRRVAMNQLKIKLRTKNSTTRKKIMLELQKSFTTQNSHIEKGNHTPDHGKTNYSPSKGGVHQNGGQFHTPNNTAPTTYQPPVQVPIPATPIRTTPSTPIRTTPSVPVRPNPPRGPHPGGNR